MTVRQTSANTKHAIVLYSIELMRRAGLDVLQAKRDDGYTLTVTVPPDPPDIHAENLASIQADNAARNAVGHATAF